MILGSMKQIEIWVDETRYVFVGRRRMILGSMKRIEIWADELCVWTQAHDS